MSVDHELVQAASRVVQAHGRGVEHTVAAAARAGDGRIVTALNVHHFTGGPCAELVVIGRAAAEGVRDLVTIVAVGDRDRAVMPPCGRCRQVLIDYFPAIDVIIGTPGKLRSVPISALLPSAYLQPEHP